MKTKIKNTHNKTKETPFNSTIERLVLAFLLSLIILMLTALYVVPEAAARICSEIISNAIQILSIIANILMPAGLLFCLAFIVNLIFGIFLVENIIKTKIINTSKNLMNLLNLASFNALMFFKSPKTIKIGGFAALTTLLFLISSFLYLLTIALIPELRNTANDNIGTFLLKMYIIGAIMNIPTFIFIFSFESIDYFKKIIRNRNSPSSEEGIKQIAQILKDPTTSETIKKTQTEKERNQKDSK